MSMRISKSRFVAGCQCLKRLYWQVHEPELAAEPDAASAAIMQQGREVGLLAQQLFPGGVEVDASGGLSQAIRITKELVANPEIPALFEAVFEHDGVLVKTDILQRREKDRWRLVEVKSSSDLKEHHLEDMAIQSHVLSGSGLDIASVWLAHINRAYVLAGETVDPRQFFLFRNLTHRVRNLQPTLVFQLRSQFRVLAMPTAPDLPTGPQCTHPVVCEFFERCNPPRPDDFIGYLPRIHASAMQKLEEMGVESIHDIPADFELTEIQRRAADCVQTGEPWFSAELMEELGKLEYPLYSMDFETVNPVIPRFPGMRPYDHLPFQWSVHVQTQPGAASEHFEFLAGNRCDPRNAFIASLCEALGERGTIVVYNQQFESQRLWEFAAWLPEFAGKIKKIQARLWDLLLMIRKHVYHPQFAGSYSLKAVLPALIPEMTYEGMEVANGQHAGLAWESLVRETADRSDRVKIRKALLAYCGQDTLALVRLLDRLRRDNR